MNIIKMLWGCICTDITSHTLSLSFALSHMPCFDRTAKSQPIDLIQFLFIVISFKSRVSFSPFFQCMTFRTKQFECIEFKRQVFKRRRKHQQHEMDWSMRSTHTHAHVCVCCRMGQHQFVWRDFILNIELRVDSGLFSFIETIQNGQFMSK